LDGLKRIEKRCKAVSPPQETEIKLELPPANLARLPEVPMLRRVGGSKQNEEQQSVYFDTKRLKLKRRGLTLRVRRIGERYVQTIKSDRGNPFDRGEWETEIGDGRPDLKHADGTALEPLGLKKLRRKLRPVFETRVRRTTYPLRQKGCDIALTLDRGQIDAGHRKLPLCEAELELKAGDRARLFDLARSFARATSAELAVKSKAQRGYELLDDANAAAVKGGEIELAANLPAAAAFEVIAIACLKQVVANKPAILAGDPEGVHQMRVGLRRLRAAISLFSDMFSEPEARPIKAQLKWLTNELGPAREFEVFLTKVMTPLKRRHRRLIGMRSLARDLAGRREAALTRALNAVCSTRFRDLTLSVAAWTETGSWRRPRNKVLRERCEEPIEIAARAQLRQLWKKIRKRGRLLAKLDPRARHKLRIQAKKLRYATEFYKSVFPEKKQEQRRESFLSTLKDMQDCLGELNDIFMHEKLTTTIATASGPRSSKRSRPIFAAGLVTGHEQAWLKSLQAAAEHAFGAFEKIKPYWK
jgi:triphosphatase